MEKKHSVLVVEDSKVSMARLVQILTDDYTVYMAVSGTEAIQVAKAVMPDIILMDVVMPQMDGFSALAMLKETEGLSDVPVIFITALGQDDSEEKGLILGAVDYISKPYNPVIVRLRVALHLKLMEQRRTIENLSMMDSTMQIPNRKYFERRLHEEWVRAARDGRNLGLLFIDVDEMREYNTVHGYSQGDRGLFTLGEIIAEEAGKRPGDVTARWAGAGFAILMLDTTPAECHAMAERIRSVVQEATVTTDKGIETKFTVSVGANCLLPSPEHTPDGFVGDTDAALYTAESLGRNQVVLHTS
jgi:diguanylate cyclase (GGDEF)-like protein